MEPTIQNPSVEGSRTADSEPPRAGGRRFGFGALALVAGVALLVGGFIGTGVGWKIEQNRVKDDVKNVRPIGTVTAVTDDAITVNLRTGSGRRTYALTDRTVIDKAETGSSADIEEGVTVFLRTRRGDDGTLEAAQVVVLPEELPPTGQ